MTKFEVLFSKKLKKSLKKVVKQGKDIDKVLSIVELIANQEPLPPKYKNTNLSIIKIIKTA